MFKIKNAISSGKKPVAPHDCALLFGLPLTRECFLRKLNGPRDGHFAESFRSSSQELSWSGYEPIAKRLLQTAELAESLGVRVFREMRLQEIAVACEFSAVTVISHWRSAQFKPGDFVDMKRILAVFDSDPGNPLSCDPDVLAKQLNARLLKGIAQPDERIGAQTSRQMALVERRRIMISAAPEAFRGGAGVEFTNGFEDGSSITANFPPSFRGVLDLTICNSLVVAEMVRRRCPRCLILATTEAVYPDSKLPFYDATIRLLAVRPLAYEDAVEVIRELLRKEIK